MVRRKQRKPGSDVNSKKTPASRTGKIRTKRTPGASQQSNQQDKSRAATSPSNERVTKGPTSESSTCTVSAVERSQPNEELLIEMEDTRPATTAESHSDRSTATATLAIKDTEGSTAAQSSLQATDGTPVPFLDYEMIDALEWMDQPPSTLSNYVAGLVRYVEYFFGPVNT